MLISVYKRNPNGQGFAAFRKVVSGYAVVQFIHQLPDIDQYLIEPVMILKMSLLKVKTLGSVHF